MKGYGTDTKQGCGLRRVYKVNFHVLKITITWPGMVMKPFLVNTMMTLHEKSGFQNIHYRATNPTFVALLWVNRNIYPTFTQNAFSRKVK